MGHLAVANIPAVEPYIETGIYTLKVQVREWCVLVLIVVEVGHICSAWVVLWHIRWVKCKWIPDICVLVIVISVHLPYRWNRDIIKARHIIALTVEFVLKLVNAVIVAELPGSIQKLYSVRVIPCIKGCAVCLPSRNIVIPIRHSVLMQNMQIFVVTRNDHNNTSCG